MHHRSARLLLLLAVPMALGACATTIDATRVGVPVTLAAPTAATAAGTPFKITRHPTYGLFGLTAISEPSLDRVLATQLVGAKEIRNVRVKVKSRWIDVLVTGLTLGLIVPRTMIVEGTVLTDSTAAGIPPAAPVAPAPVPAPPTPE